MIQQLFAQAGMGCTCFFSLFADCLLAFALRATDSQGMHKHYSRVYLLVQRSIEREACQTGDASRILLARKLPLFLAVWFKKSATVTSPLTTCERRIAIELRWLHKDFLTRSESNLSSSILQRRRATADWGSEVSRHRPPCQRWLPGRPGSQPRRTPR